MIARACHFIYSNCKNPRQSESDRSVYLFANSILNVSLFFYGFTNKGKF